MLHLAILNFTWLSPYILVQFSQWILTATSAKEQFDTEAERPQNLAWSLTPQVYGKEGQNLPQDATLLKDTTEAGVTGSNPTLPPACEQLPGSKMMQDKTRSNQSCWDSAKQEKFARQLGTAQLRFAKLAAV